MLLAVLLIASSVLATVDLVAIEHECGDDHTCIVKTFHKLRGPSDVGFVMVSNMSMPDQQDLDFEGIGAYGASPASIRQAFQNRFGGVNPDGIALNNEVQYAGVLPPITVQYGYPCYQDLGTRTFSNGQTTSDDELILAEQTVVNNSPNQASTTVGLTGTISESTSVSWSVTSGLKITASFSVFGLFTGGTEFSLEAMYGETTTTTTQRSVQTSVTVVVPPFTSVRVTMNGLIQRSTINVRVPVQANGWFGANFPRQVDGAYFWFLSAGSVMPTTSAIMDGVVTGAYSIDTQTQIFPPIPLPPHMDPRVPQAVGINPNVNGTVFQ